MPEPAAPSAASSAAPSRGLVIGSWVARAVVAVIFLMGAVPKLGGPDGPASALAEKLPNPGVSLYAIAIVELAAVVLILLPKTARIGAALAAVTMLGALGSHFVGPVGLEGDAGGMWPMALVAFVAAVASFLLVSRIRSPGG